MLADILNETLLEIKNLTFPLCFVMYNIIRVVAIVAIAVDDVVAAIDDVVAIVDDLRVRISLCGDVNHHSVQLRLLGRLSCRKKRKVQFIYNFQTKGPSMLS